MAESIYFLKSGEAIKIGYSADVAARVREISIYQPLEPELIGTMPGGRSLEEAIHVFLRQHRIKGEWFRDCAEVRGTITDLIARGGPAVDFSPPPRRRLVPISEPPPELPAWEAAATELNAIAARFKAIHKFLPDGRATRAIDFFKTSISKFQEMMEAAFEREVEDDPVVVGALERLMSEVRAEMKDIENSR